METKIKVENLLNGTAAFLICVISFNFLGLLGIPIGILCFLLFIAARDVLSVNAVPFLVSVGSMTISYYLQYEIVFAASTIIASVALFNMAISYAWLSYSMMEKPIASHDYANTMAREHAMLHGPDVAKEAVVYLQHRYGTSSDESNASAAEVYTNYLYFVIFFGVNAVALSFNIDVLAVASFFIFGFICPPPKHAMPSYLFNDRSIFFGAASVIAVLASFYAMSQGNLVVSLGILFSWVVGITLAVACKRHVYSTMYTII